MFKYKVPLSYHNQSVSFTVHSSWRDAYKYAKRRGVPMFRIWKNSEENNYQAGMNKNRFINAIKPFLQKLRRRKNTR